MESFDFKHEDFVTVARMDSDAVLATYQGSRIVVLALELKGTPLTTLLTLPPKRQYFTQDWWLGQAYWNWQCTAPLDKTLSDSILRGFKRSGLAFKNVPLNFLTLDGAFDKRGSVALWDPCLFLSVTVPSEALNCALNAFQASHNLVSDYLFTPLRDDDSPSYGSSYGDAQIERALSVKLPRSFLGTTYRNPLLQLLSKSNLHIPTTNPEPPQNCLQHVLNELKDVSAQLSSNRSKLLRDVQRWQFFYLFDAKEFAPELRSVVVRVNTLRSQILKVLKAPHFFRVLTTRQLYTSRDTLQKSYRYQPNERDWMLQLQKVSPESLSPTFEELKNVDDYILNMKQQYPCFADDPLKKVLPKCLTRAVKI